MATDYWAHHYFDNPRQDEVEDDDFDLDAVLDEYARENDWEEVDLNDDQNTGPG